MYYSLRNRSPVSPLPEWCPRQSGLSQHNRGTPGLHQQGVQGIHQVSYDIQAGSGSGPEPTMQAPSFAGPLQRGLARQGASPMFTLNWGPPIIRYQAVLTLIPVVDTANFSGRGPCS